MTATTTAIAMMGVNLIAITTLIFGVYFPRYRRPDLVVAFLGVNIGVFAVAEVLANSTAGMALGIGLFGVLSIIRLRSTEISQKEVAYYFAALAIGLIAGLGTVSVTPIAFISLIVASLAVIESIPALRNYEELEIQIDRCIVDSTELKAELARMLRADIKGVRVLKHDMVNDWSLVQVRFVANATPALPTGGEQQDTTNYTGHDHTAASEGRHVAPAGYPASANQAAPASRAAEGNNAPMQMAVTR